MEKFTYVLKLAMEQLLAKMVNQLPNMFGNAKRKAASLSVISLVFLITSCSTKVQKIEGETQGTTYHITIVGGEQTIHKTSIDSIFKTFDTSLSTYQSNSVISDFNTSENGIWIPKEDQYFFKCLELSKSVHSLTNGAFDPSVFPLVEAWGFMKKMDQPPSKEQVDSILQFVNFTAGDIWHQDKKTTFLGKKDPRFKLDFNAIAQGYSVDVIADYLVSNGIENYFIEIGGELRVAGKNAEGKKWRIGVDLPVESNEGKGAREIGQVLELGKGGLATSGNYRKFYEKEGKKYAHTLNPKTGFPAENELLSATVLAPNAGLADGYATAFMVMGLSGTKEWLKLHPSEKLEVLLIYTDANGEMKIFTSNKMKKMLL